MDSFDSWSEEDRKIFLQQAIPATPISQIILEKDYWVAWVLKRIFKMPEVSSHIIFKGGTSLSKAFGIIRRFSEDIDLSFDREFLGFDGSKDPIAAPSKSAREQRLKELSLASGTYVKEKLLPLLKNNFAESSIQGDWRLDIDPEEAQNILFYFPRGLERNANEYITPYVKIEFGARSDPWPLTEVHVKSYLSELFPKEVPEEEGPKIKVLTVARTFWEKLTILHAEHHRPDSKTLPIRHSRHFYDFWAILGSTYAEEAASDRELLERVIAHKEVFFRSGWASYSTARPGSLKLSPKAEQMTALNDDYSKMQDMFFEEPEQFSDILEKISKFEETFNS